MIPIIPDQRKFKSNARQPFDDLIKYVTKDSRDITVTDDKNIEGQLTRASVVDFSDLINYAVGSNEKNTDSEKCIAIRTHGVNDIVTASIEMNAVARKNFRCEDAAYHFILSWPEHEHPAVHKIFGAAVHAIKALGLAEHQYVLAIHGNTDNLHCHVSVNRVHPTTFRSRHLEWSHKTLHLAARQSEIKHGWSHDNGIYVVEVDGRGKKSIVLNKDPYVGASTGSPPLHGELGREGILPAWHDPDSLESWLKTKVSKALKRDLAELTSWQALHAWLDQYDITLTDSGGGGMRLHTTSQETGEILNLAASKGLRILKRADLEKRWGPFINSPPISCVVHDLSHLTPEQIKKGVDHVLTRTNDGGRPPDHVLARNPQLGRIPEHIFGAETDTDINEADQGSGLNRDDSKRAERKEQRAAARADLRLRFSQYMRFVRFGDTEHFESMKALQSDRSLALKQLREESKIERSNVKAPKLGVERLLANIQIDADVLREKLKIESSFQEKSRSLREIRTPPLSWRAWLYEQSNLGDQAALSALRGIVYQAQRDAKAKDDSDKADELEEEQADTAEYRERQYRKVMARLLKEEQEETAIRSANSQVMRPHEIDALIQRYQGIQWRVTGNGNVEYSDLDGGHLFTDRGSRVTFDRVRVTDKDIQLALIHAQNKFGNNLTLTGDDPIFTARMARLADDMGIGVLNPELQVVIENHREAKKVEIIEALTVVPVVRPQMPELEISAPLERRDAEGELERAGQELLSSDILGDPKSAIAERNGLALREALTRGLASGVMDLFKSMNASGVASALRYAGFAVDESVIERGRSAVYESVRPDLQAALDLRVDGFGLARERANPKTKAPELVRAQLGEPESAQKKQKQESEPAVATTPVQTRGETPAEQPIKETQPEPIENNPAQPVSPAVTPPEVIQVVQEPIKTPQERLRAMVLSIDPHATFETADPENSAKQYIGAVAASLDDQTNPGFAQRTGRGVYTLHATNAPAEHNDASIEIQYRNGQAIPKIKTQGKGNWR